MTNTEQWWLTIVTAVLVGSVVSIVISIKKLKTDNNLK